MEARLTDSQRCGYFPPNWRTNTSDWSNGCSSKIYFKNYFVFCFFSLYVIYFISVCNCIINLYSIKRRTALKYEQNSFTCRFNWFLSATDAGCCAPITDRPEVTPLVAALASEHHIWMRKVWAHISLRGGFCHNAPSVAKVFTTQTDIFVLVAIHNGT